MRLHTKEQLDDLSLSGRKLNKALFSLKLINILFGNRRQLSKTVIKYCLERPHKKKIHIIDLGCGGGDCINYLSKKLKQHHISATFMGIDGNPETIAYASRNNTDPKNIQFISADILASDFTIPQCDLVISSHFIYHFTNENLHIFLNKLKFRNIKHVIFSELYRNKMSYYLFKWSRFMLPISHIAREDGLTAIQRAFTTQELRSVLLLSNSEQWKITKKPWFRMIVKIEM